VRVARKKRGNGEGALRRGLGEHGESIQRMHSSGLGGEHWATAELLRGRDQTRFAVPTPYYRYTLVAIKS